MKDAQIGIIFETVSYDQFIPNKKNRGDGQLDMRWVRELSASFLKDGQHTPIEVDSGFRIGAGHHRLAAAKNAGLPIKYVFVDKVDQRFIVESHSLQKPYTLTQTINTYSGRGNYKKFIELLAETGLSNGSLMLLMTNKTIAGTIKKNITSGSFEITPKMLLTFKKRWAQISKFVEATEDKPKTQKALVAVKVLQVLLVMMENPDFSAEHFMKRLRANGTKVNTNNNLEVVAENLEGVYNQFLYTLPPISLVFAVKNDVRSAEAAAYLPRRCNDTV